MRLFLGGTVSSSSHFKIRQAILDLPRDLTTLKWRWIPMENWHITFHFLGDVTPELLLSLKEELIKIKPPFPHPLLLDKLLLFPSPEEAIVLTLGTTAPPPILGALHEELKLALIRLGIPTENQAWTPHLTLARVANAVHWRRKLEVNSVEVTLDKVRLFETKVAGGLSLYSKVLDL